MPISEPRKEGISLTYGIGRRLRSVRNQYGLTQKEFSEILNISQSYLSEVENNKNKANIEIIVGIGEAFPKININWLLTGRGENNSIVEKYSEELNSNAIITAFEVVELIDLKNKNKQEIRNKAKFFQMILSLYMKTFKNSIKEYRENIKDAERMARYICFDIVRDFDPEEFGLEVSFGPPMSLFADQNADEIQRAKLESPNSEGGVQPGASNRKRKEDQ